MTALKPLLSNSLHDPFALLGHNHHAGISSVCVLIPGAKEVLIDQQKTPASRIEGTDIFIHKPCGELPKHYTVQWKTADGSEHSAIDPYSFAPLISDYDLHLIGKGKHRQIYNVLGANHRQVDGVEGVLFATWAPNATKVSVISDFNNWNGLRHPMRCRGDSGIWELFIPEVNDGDCYKFEIFHHNKRLEKSDPFGQQFEFRPKTAARIKSSIAYHWNDSNWQQQASANWSNTAVSIYELHVGSWRRQANGDFLGYRELAHKLVPYIHDMGFTHIELLPISEHPFDGSWGYQTIGYYAPSSRFGTADDFRYFVDYCHQHNIGVILDWVASHFPKDDHGLNQYDGTALYEHDDPSKGEHPDWGTLIFNFGRNEVKNFLISNALFWLEEFHIDGLRVDAVASMIYLDYSRKVGEWVPNCYGGNENLEAVAFLKELNEVTHAQFPGTMIIAEESTSWPMVSKPTYVGGLGFSMKWNMGWMNDTLEYMAKDPIHRHYHHDKLTFGMMYAYSENFLLALSHDEVVHGKSSLLHKMPGDDWKKFANLRLLYLYMFTYPGKKLLFMGNEFAQRNEWDHDSQLDWSLLKHNAHKNMQLLVGDLNRLYRNSPAMHDLDFEPEGFQWIDCHDSDHSILSYLRYGKDHAADQHNSSQHAAVVLNFTPIVRSGYRIGIPYAEYYAELINSDSEFYGGSNVGNSGAIKVEPVPYMGFSHSIVLTLPPLAGLVLIPESQAHLNKTL